MALLQLYRNRKAIEASAIIDDDDLPLLAGYRRWSIWHPRGSRTAYARSSLNGKTVYLHRLILAAQPGEEIDHIDGNGLNNCRANLRRVSHAENIQAAVARQRFNHPPHPVNWKGDVWTVKMKLASGKTAVYRYDRKTRKRLPDENAPST